MRRGPERMSPCCLSPRYAAGITWAAMAGKTGRGRPRPRHRMRPAALLETAFNAFPAHRRFRSFVEKQLRPGFAREDVERSNRTILALTSASRPGAPGDCRGG